MLAQNPNSPATGLVTRGNLSAAQPIPGIDSPGPAVFAAASDDARLYDDAPAFGGAASFVYAMTSSTVILSNGATIEMKDKAIHRTHTSGSTQRGQAIVLIALGFVVLLAFTGLVVDVARVFATRGELRRAVDAAGLAATAQFRQGATGQKIVNAAYDLVATHGILSSTVSVETCNLAGHQSQRWALPACGK